jgi:hypothetical protein
LKTRAILRKTGMRFFAARSSPPGAAQTLAPRRFFATRPPAIRIKDATTLLL